MAFRRDKEESLHWQKWLERHRDELLACGVTFVVLQDASHWHYFLGHGYFTPIGSAEPVINVDHMSHDDALRLCLFLEQDKLHSGCDAVNRLQYLLKKGKHAATL